MLEQSIIIIFFISLIGMGLIIWKKIPVLIELPVEEIEEEKILKKIRERIRNNHKIKLVSSGNILLQKMLSKVRILTLRTDKKTSLWLSKLRQKSIKKKETFLKRDWEKLKKK